MTWIEQDKYNEILSLIPIVCVDIAIAYNNKILLIKRRDEPAQDEWWLPGGRLFKGETFEGCALRKAKEETGLECRLGPMIYYQSTDFGNIHSVNFCYLLHIADDMVKLDDTCLDHRWVEKDEMVVVGYDINYVVHSYVFECLVKAFRWLNATDELRNLLISRIEDAPAD